MKRTYDQRESSSQNNSTPRNSSDVSALSSRFDEDRGQPSSIAQPSTSPRPSLAVSSTSSTSSTSKLPLAPIGHSDKSTPSSTQIKSGNGVSAPPSLESDAHRLEQREKQIAKGKNTLGYQRYTAAVPRHQRKKGDPRTPPLHQQASKRAWDGLYKIWRKDLHVWDLGSPQEEVTSPKSENPQNTTHSQSADLARPTSAALPHKATSEAPKTPEKASAEGDDELAEIERQLREIENGKEE